MPLQSWQKTAMKPRWLEHQRDPGGLLDTMVEMTSRALRVPTVMVSSVYAGTHGIIASYGLPESITAIGQVPPSHSLCKHVVAMGRPLVISDALSHPLVSESPTVREFGLTAYLGEPLHGPDGNAIGCFSAFDYRARDWTEIQRRMMSVNAMIIERAMNWQDQDTILPPA